MLAYSPTGNPWFEWMPGQENGGGNSSLTQNLGTGQISVIQDNRAFVLSGTVIPLPATVWLLTSALASIGLLRRSEKGRGSPALGRPINN
ncbi:MAG: hypothetical protein KJO54_08320 [Gammaproteobacteria bacterium]|nr:hypothetical protein [Gammaproteobacteria bacterium]NNF60185.1 hypothetical protein [Gammaproteobacteria bacterium]NNM21598.1 hypothetical protein [Gammaproteobacteria bacterium]